MRWVGHIARIVEMKNAYNILFGKREGKRQLKYVGVDVRTVLECILWK